MAKGAQAKASVMKILEEAFGEKFIGEVDKKVYVWGEEDGSYVQIALSLTCPKNMVPAAMPGTGAAVGVDLNECSNEAFDWSSPAITEKPKENPVEFTQEEENNIMKLIQSLGL